MQLPNTEIAQIQAGIAALEAQRAALGDAVVDASVFPLRERLAALEAANQPTQQRKLVTVLFADVSGFTTLSETMDAEVVAAIINDLWSLLDRAIVDHGGRIDKHMGDEVMALWGADTAREDDPEMAVRAALAMQTAIADFCATHSVPLAMRIGLNTGPALLGAVGTTAEFTAMGDSVNLASRLEQAAPVSGILISHDTYRHIRGIFDVEAREPFQVKGRAAPVQSYVVLRAKPRAFHMAVRGVEGVETRMIGRDAELLALQNAFADVADGIETRLVVVTGEAGVGKSRLLYEFDNWLELRPERVYYFKGRGSPNRQNAPYSLFRDLFAFRFQILDSDSTTAALDKFSAGMAGILEQAQAAVVGHWLGFNFTGSESVKALIGSDDFDRVARAYLVRYFRTLAAAGPVVVLLEDIHWADDLSLDLATYLPGAISEAKLLILAVARLSLFERRPGWAEGQAAFARVNLAPLSRRASRALVDEILQRVDRVPDDLRDLVVNMAEGNPFFVEEMVKMLIDQRVIVRGRHPETGTLAADPQSLAAQDEDQWSVQVDRMATLSIPPTLTGLLQARLDALPPIEREALQRAAVVGRIFWDGAVAELSQAGRAIVHETLQAVRERELIFRREHSTFADVDEYIFKHSLLRDVAYETVLLRYRADYHRRVASWLESHAGERRKEYLGLIAEHYIQAGETLRAAELLEQAGYEAVNTGVWGAARQTLERARQLREAAGDTGSPATARALIAMGRVLWKTGNFAEAEAEFERARVAAQAAEDADREATAMAWLAQLKSEQGEPERALSLIEAARHLALQANGQSLALVLFIAANAAWGRGDFDAAEALAYAALERAELTGDSYVATAIPNVLGIVAADRLDWQRSDEHFQTFLASARADGRLSSEAVALLNLGYNAYRSGDYDAALAYGESAVERMQELGQLSGLPNAMSNLAQANLHLGDIAVARHWAHAGLAIARDLNHLPGMVWAVFLFGQINMAEGNLPRALALLALAGNHPARDHQMQIEVDEELARPELSAAQIEAGLAAAAALDFDMVVAEILDGRW